MESAYGICSRSKIPKHLRSDLQHALRNGAAASLFLLQLCNPLRQVEQRALGSVMSDGS